jgi:CRP/FNR family transcriptional regulator, anaerobic regulatory protein
MFDEFLNDTTNIELQQLIKSKTKITNFYKNEMILEKGKVCKNLYFIDNGLARGFFIDDDGKDITNWFAPEGTLATSTYSFISQNPSFENIVALEDCKMQTISRKTLYDLYDKFPEMNEMGRKLIEIYYLELEERVNALQFQTAKQRYEKFVKQDGYLLQRTSLGHIASYLGITQETLSRIRNQI